MESLRNVRPKHDQETPVDDGDRTRNPEKRPVGDSKDSSQQRTEVFPNKNCPGRFGCSICGLKNHSTEDCRRKEYVKCATLPTTVHLNARGNRFGIWGLNFVQHK